MAAKGAPLGTPGYARPTFEAGTSQEDLVFIALPVSLHRHLCDEAAKRQQTLAQFLAKAVTEALERPGPQLLTEVK